MLRFSSSRKNVRTRTGVSSLEKKRIFSESEVCPKVMARSPWITIPESVSDICTAVVVVVVVVAKNDDCMQEYARV
jgi:hypothetical protein